MKPKKHKTEVHEVEQASTTEEHHEEILKPKKHKTRHVQIEQQLEDEVRVEHIRAPRVQKVHHRVVHHEEPRQVRHVRRVVRHTASRSFSTTSNVEVVVRRDDNQGGRRVRRIVR